MLQNFNVEDLRKDFSILSACGNNGKPLIYLDSAATSQKPKCVINAVNHFYAYQNANVHRGLHFLSEQATAAFENARVLVSNFIRARSEKSIIFTHGTTESINLVANGWGGKFLNENDEVLLTVMEHHSNIVPWQLLGKERGLKLKYITIDNKGLLNMEGFYSLMNPKVKLVALTGMSNVLGTINPVKEIIDAAHQAGSIVLLDAAQSVPHIPVNVEQLDVDFLAFSGHKICGPTGIGILYGKEELLEEMDPFMGGGEMISKVSLQESTWADLPYKFEAGTPNIAGAVGLGAALNYISDIGLNVIHEYINDLAQYAIIRLLEIKGLTLWGMEKERGGAISFSLDGIHPHDVSQCLDQEGIGIRAGHLCCQPLMDILKVPAVCRASLYFYNTKEEVDRLVDSLKITQRLFGYGS